MFAGQRRKMDGGSGNPVVIVAPVRLFRDGLEQVLAGRGRLVLASTASRGEALHALTNGSAGTVLVDMAMPAALDTVRAIARRCPEADIVALGVPDAEADVIACAEAGAAGYVSREGSLEDLISALDSVSRGELLCPPRIAAGLRRRVAALAAARAPVTPLGNLTRREAEVAGLIDAGLSNKQIAQRLCIEVPTVKNHVHNILEKLQVHRRGEAAAVLRHDAIVAPQGSDLR